jgi:altronate dehydratase
MNAGLPGLARRWHDLMDVDAGRIATGDATIEEIGWELFRTMLDVASGRRRTWTEKWRLRALTGRHHARDRCRATSSGPLPRL